MSLLCHKVQTCSTFSWSPIRLHKDTYFVGTLDSQTPKYETLTLKEVTSTLDVKDNVTCVAWGCPNREGGILAAGFENGSIGIYNPSALLKGDEATLAYQTKHTSKVTTIDFNPKESILASGSEKGEVLIWNLREPTAPEVYTIGSNITDPLSCVKWNSVVPYFLCTATLNGKIAVWDLRKKAAVAQFTDKAGRLTRCKDLAWHPTNPALLITANEDNNYPVIQLWNIKSTHYPLKVFEGHSRGILSTSWNSFDNRFLLSTGHDNKAICWDVETGAIAQEIPLETTNNFKVQWSPNQPDLFGIASNEGIQTFSLYDVENSASPPQWVTKRSGVAFGFGGKLVSANDCSNNQLRIEQAPMKQEIVSSINEFERLNQISDLESYCESKLQSVGDSPDDQDTWKFLRAAVSSDQRKQLLSTLGFSESELQKVTEKLSQSSFSSEKSATVNDGDENTQNDSSAALNNSNNSNDQPERKDDVSNLFSSDFSDSNYDPFEMGGDFGSSNFETEDKSFGDSFGALPEEPKHDSIIEMAKNVKDSFEFSSNSPFDEMVSSLLIYGRFEAAVDACFQNNKVTEAIALAFSSGDHKLIEATLNRYFAKERTPFIRLASYISQHKLKELVASAHLADWKLTLATLCSHSAAHEFEDLCNSLGELLEHSGKLHEASLCYSVAKNLEKTTEIWLQRTVSDDLQGLLQFIEKSTILQRVSNSSCSALIANYTKYSELLCSQGRLDIGLQILNSLGDHIHKSSAAQSLLNRINISLKNAPISSSSNFNYDNDMMSGFNGHNNNSSNSNIDNGSASLFSGYNDDVSSFNTEEDKRSSEFFSSLGDNSSFDSEFSYTGGAEHQQQHHQQQPEVVPPTHHAYVSPSGAPTSGNVGGASIQNPFMSNQQPQQPPQQQPQPAFGNYNNNSNIQTPVNIPSNPFSNPAGQVSSFTAVTPVSGPFGSPFSAPQSVLPNNNNFATPFFNTPSVVPVEPLPDLSKPIAPSSAAPTASTPVPQNQNLKVIQELRDGIAVLKSKYPANKSNLDNLDSRLSHVEKSIKDKKISADTLSIYSSLAQHFAGGDLEGGKQDFEKLKTLYLEGHQDQVPSGFWLGLKKIYP